MLPALRPFLFGLVLMPLVKRVAKPVLREVVKASVGIALDVKNAAADARAELQVIAAEASAEHPPAKAVRWTP